MGRRRGRTLRPGTLDPLESYSETVGTSSYHAVGVLRFNISPTPLTLDPGTLSPSSSRLLPGPELRLGTGPARDDFRVRL